MPNSSFATHATEIVYDSEPERTQKRIERRQRKLQRLNAASPDSAGPSTERARTNTTGHKDDGACSVIELTDSDSSMSIIVPKAIPQVVPIASSSTKPQPQPAAEMVEDDDEPAPVKALDINRFAFVDPVCKKGRAPSAKPPQPPKAPAAASKPTRRAPSQQAKAALEIPSSDLDKILRCVGCDAEWTTRKTAVQKLSHIRTCAKKHGLTNETVEILVRRAVDKYVPPAPGKGKGKEVPKEPATKATYYEEVLGDAAPKKRTKRQLAETLLTNVSANRDDILARAQNVLQTAPSVTPAAQLFRPTTPTRDTSPFHPTPPQATQQFGSSSLLAQVRARTATTTATKTKTKSLFDAIYSSPPAAPLSTFSSPEGALKTPSKRARPLDLDGEDGDAADRYRDISSVNDSPTSAKLRDALKSLVLERLDEQDVLPVAEKTPAARKPAATRKAKTPKTPKAPALEFDEEWESFMKEAIMKDDELYTRVLRYEPIHFNEFLPLAESYTQDGKAAASTAKLRLVLRKYLDDQAINFYDESWKRR